MGLATEQRAWRQPMGLVSVLPSHKTGIGKRPLNEVLNAANKAKLQLALDIAPAMVDAALEALNELDDYRPEYKTRPHVIAKRKIQPDPTYDEAALALLKYFTLRCLPDDPMYWQRVQGIMTVLQQMHEGLSGAYELVIADLECNGRVIAHGKLVTKPVSMVRETFGFSDEFGHSAYTWPERRGRIQLAWRYLSDPKVAAADVARTLVHEASHKWAHTKDVLYKTHSFSRESKEDQAFLGTVGVQPQRLQRPGGKELVSLAGQARTINRPIESEEWLQNADSYAWLARRLWKRKFTFD